MALSIGSWLVSLLAREAITNTYSPVKPSPQVIYTHTQRQTDRQTINESLPVCMCVCEDTPHLLFVECEFVEGECAGLVAAQHLNAGHLFNGGQPCDDRRFLRELQGTDRQH